MSALAGLREVVAPLRAGLALLRRRVRALLLLHGIARLVVLALLMLGVQFAADYTLRLPLGARAFYLLLLLAGLAYVAARHLFRPLLASSSDTLLARRVEAAHPELADRLLSSLAFERAVADPENEESPALMRLVAEQTAAMAGSIPFAAVAVARIPARWGALAALLVVLAGLSATAHPAETSIFLRRAVLLSDVSWPRRTTLAVVDMAPGESRRITLGRECAIQIRAEGSAPERVLFTFWERGADGGAGHPETVELAPSAEDPSLFAFGLLVAASYSFTVTGGDDDRALEYRIDALRPPAVLGIEMQCTFPPYLGMAPETLTGGDQRVPEGTSIRLLVRTNMDLARASVSFGSGEPRPLEPEGARAYALDLVVDRDLRYALRLSGANGEENDAGTDTFVIRVAKDHPPVVRVLTPGARTERLAGGVVLVAFTARDDYRIDRTVLRYTVGEGKERTVVLGESGGDAVVLRRAPGSAGEGGADALLALAVIDLARLLDDQGNPLRAGSFVQYGIDATDSAGQAQRARTLSRIEAIPDEDLARLAEAWQQELREAVPRARDHAGNPLFDGHAEARAEPGELRRWAGRAQATQARVIDDLDTLSRQVQNLLNLYVFNRWGESGTAEQILPYYETHLLEAGDGSGQSFRGSLYRTLRLAQEEKAIRTGLGYAKLVEMCDLADRLAADHAPAAYRALARAGARETLPEAIDAALAEALARRQSVLDGLDRLARLMHEWQTFETAVRSFKALRDTQADVVRDLEGVTKPGR